VEINAKMAKIRTRKKFRAILQNPRYIVNSPDLRGKLFLINLKVHVTINQKRRSIRSWIQPVLAANDVFTSLAFISRHECAGSSGMEPTGAWIRKNEIMKKK